MRVRFDSTRLPTAPASRGGEGPREVPPRQTTLSPGEIRRALAAAHQNLHGESIPSKMLDVLTAQACHETAHGASMYNYNFGGIKGSSPEGTTARLRTREVLQGKEVSITDGFRAYSTPVAGATDYLLLLERRFPRAVDAAREGDVDGFVRSLKAGHYFTADPDQYAASVRGILSGGFDREHPRGELRDDLGAGATSSYMGSSHSAMGLSSNFPTTAAVARVLDAVAAASVDIASPPKET